MTFPIGVPAEPHEWLDQRIGDQEEHSRARGPAGRFDVRGGLDLEPVPGPAPHRAREVRGTVSSRTPAVTSHHREMARGGYHFIPPVTDAIAGGVPGRAGARRARQVHQLLRAVRSARVAVGRRFRRVQLGHQGVGGAGPRPVLVSHRRRPRRRCVPSRPRCICSTVAPSRGGGTSRPACGSTPCPIRLARLSRIGVQGLAPYWFEVEASAYVEPSGRTHVRVETEYDLLVTNRLVLQPLVEFEIYGRADRERHIGTGLSTGEVGLRLRYEFRREFAPYVGVVWTRRFFGSADLAQRGRRRGGGSPVGGRPSDVVLGGVAQGFRKRPQGSLFSFRDSTRSIRMTRRLMLRCIRCTGSCCRWAPSLTRATTIRCSAPSRWLRPITSCSRTRTTRT